MIIHHCNNFPIRLDSQESEIQQLVEFHCVVTFSAFRILLDIGYKKLLSDNIQINIRSIIQLLIEIDSRYGIITFSTRQTFATFSKTVNLNWGLIEFWITLCSTDRNMNFVRKFPGHVMKIKCRYLTNLCRWNSCLLKYSSTCCECNNYLFPVVTPSLWKRTPFF